MGGCGELGYVNLNRLGYVKQLSQVSGLPVTRLSANLRKTDNDFTVSITDMPHA